MTAWDKVEGLVLSGLLAWVVATLLARLTWIFVLSPIIDLIEHLA